MGELVPFPVSRCVGFLRENSRKAAAARDPIKAIDAAVALYEKRLALMKVEPDMARQRVESMRGALRYYASANFGDVGVA